MAVATILLPVGAAILADGSAGNETPAVQRIQGTEANPKKHVLVLAFDAATEERVWFDFRLPGDAAASPAPVVKLQWASIAAITATNVVWAAAIGAITAGDVDTPIEHASAAGSQVTSANNTVEAGRLTDVSITLANVDAVAAGDLVVLRISRVAADASDTLAEDARLYTVSFEYTLA